MRLRLRADAGERTRKGCETLLELGTMDERGRIVRWRIRCLLGILGMLSASSRAILR